MIGLIPAGGLGNQLFQIAAIHALALRNNGESAFNFGFCHTPNQGNPSTKYKDAILSKVNDMDFRIYIKYGYNETDFGYEELHYVNDTMFTGYFQSEKYFKDFKEEKIGRAHV